MRREDLNGIWSIQPIANLASIAEHGILCHNDAARLPHADVSMPAVQDIRRSKRVPDARIHPKQWRPLHDYANLYLCPRNPMLYMRLGRKNELGVLRVDVDVLDTHGVVVTDGNAASHATLFGSAAVGIERIDSEVTFAEWWIHTDPYEQAEHKRRMCAEVLVPSQVPSRFVNRVFVCSTEARDASGDLPWPKEIRPYIFFS